MNELTQSLVDALTVALELIDLQRGGISLAQEFPKSRALIASTLEKAVVEG